MIEIVERYSAFLLEDDWARDFQLGAATMAPPLAQSDRNGHVVYMRSLTKCSAPGLRVGAICAKGPAYERLRQARLVDDFFVPGILQLTTLELVSAVSWPAHLRFLRSSLKKRRDTLAGLVQQYLGEQSILLLPEGGLHLWVTLPPGLSDREVQAKAWKAGVLVNPGYHFFPDNAPGNFLRLSFAGAPPEEMQAGMLKIQQIIQP